MSPTPWPTRGLTPWGDVLKAYVDASIGSGTLINAVYDVFDPSRGTVAVGNGTTNDAPAIQARLDGLPTSPDGARGGKVLLHPGHVYGIGSTLNITLPNTDLDGIVGGTLAAMGSCTLKALPGFTGPMIRINIPSGSKGAWIRNLRLDGNSVSGVTCGIEYATGTISVAHLFDVAIANTKIGIKTNSNCQSVIWERVLAFTGLTVGVDVGADMRHCVARDCRFGGTQWAAIIGVDTNVTANAVETMIFDSCELYANGTSPSGVVLLRNAENPRLTNCYIEMSGASSSVKDSLVQVGTSNAMVRTPVITGNRFGGNAKAQYGVEIVNAAYPVVAHNGSDTNLTTGQLVKNNNSQIAMKGRGWLEGSAGNNTDMVQTEIRSMMPAGYNAYSAYVDGDNSPRFRVRNGSDPSIQFGSGSTTPDITVYRYSANVLSMAGGDNFRLDGTWDGGRLKLGNYNFWVDAAGKLRIKNGSPGSDTDGTIVGSQ